MIPVFAVLVMNYHPERMWIRHAALGVYIFAAITDALDGFIARAYNQKTRLGAILDPLADKLIINLAFVFLAVNPNFSTQVPKWFPVIILSRDALITLGAYLVNEFYGPIRVRPRILGKLTTWFQMSSIIIVLMELGFARAYLMVTLGVSIVSWADYMISSIRQLGAEEDT